MSSSAWSGGLEGIYGVALGTGPYVWLETAPVRYVHPGREEIGQVVRDPDIIEQVYRRVRLQFEQNVDVVGRRGTAARQRTEQGRMQDTPVTEFLLMGT